MEPMKEQSGSGPKQTKDVLRRLDGNMLVIPNLWPLFEGWPRARHPGYECLKHILDEYTQGNMHSLKRNIIQAANPALLVAEMWPDASFENLRVLMFYVIWQGVLDEMLERQQDSDFEQGTNFRDAVFGSINEALGFETTASSPPHKWLKFIEELSWVSQSIVSIYNEDQLSCLRKKLRKYIKSTGKEHEYALKGEMPTYETYAELRMCTSGMGPLIALAEFASKATLPSTLKDTSAWETIVKTVSKIVGLTNDLLSLKKEMTHNGFLNAIPVLLHQSPNMYSEVVNRITDDIKYLVSDFELAETELLRQAKNDEEKGQIWAVLQTLKANCTGNLSWSLQCKRYGLGRPAPDGTFTVFLELSPSRRGERHDDNEE